eukprot:gene9466-12753_t
MFEIIIRKQIKPLLVATIASTHFLTSKVSKSQPKLDVDCEKPSCRSKKDMFHKAINNLNYNVKKQDLDKTESDSNFSNLQNSANIPIVYKQCPMDKSELGQSTWGLLHTIASVYPDVPTEDDRKQAFQLIEAISMLYPCPYCAADFRDNIAIYPPKVDSHESFAIWCCERHNDVNKKLGKVTFPCNIKLLDERWKYGHAGCEYTTSENDNSSSDINEQNAETGSNSIKDNNQKDIVP